MHATLKLLFVGVVVVKKLSRKPNVQPQRLKVVDGIHCFPPCSGYGMVQEVYNPTEDPADLR